MLAILASAVVLRIGLTDSADLALLFEFQDVTGIDFGPETEWFASGVNGDGAAFAMIAADPIGAELGRSLYNASYRYGRAGYSWSAALLVLGRGDLLLLGLAGVGLLSVAIVAWVATGLRESVGLRAWWLILNPALYIGFLVDTAEPLGIALLSLALVTSSPWFAAGLAIVRPSYLVAVLRSGRMAIVGLAVAFLFRSMWVLRFRDGFFEGSSLFAWPFTGALDVGGFIAWTVVFSGLLTLAIGVRKRDLSWIASGILAMSLSAPVLEHWVSATRAVGMLPVLWAFGPASLRSLRSVHAGAVPSKKGPGY